LVIVINRLFVNLKMFVISTIGYCY